MRGLNTCGGFNHRRHETAKRQLKEFREQELKAQKDRIKNGELKGGGFIVTFRHGEVVQVVFVWAESVAQAKHKAMKYHTLTTLDDVVARAVGLTPAGRPVGLIKFN